MPPTNTKDPTALRNPYDPSTLLAGEDLRKTSILIGTSDLQFLSNLFIKKGWMQATYGFLTKALITELNNQDLTTYDPERFKSLIESVRVTFDASPRCKPNNLNGGPGSDHDGADNDRSRTETPIPNDRRGDQDLARIPDPAPSQPADPSGRDQGEAIVIVHKKAKGRKVRGV